MAALLGLPKTDFPLDDVIDHIFDQLNASKRNKGRALADHAADSLTALEHKYDASAVESARLTATELLRRFGLSDRAFAELALDTDKAATAVLDHAKFTVDENAEIMPLCVKILTSFYESVLHDPILLAELLPHIHAASLRDLGDLKAGQKTIARQLEKLCELVGSDQVESVRRENHLTQAALANMFSILSEQNVPPEQLDAKLRQIAERHVELTERLHVLAKSNDEPEITKRREQAAKALEAGDYDLADQLLAEAEAIDRQAIIEQREALDRRQFSAAMTLGQRGYLERTRLNYRKAAKHFAEAANLVSTSDNKTRLDYLLRQAVALADLGRDFGENAALVEAITIYQGLLEECSRERVPRHWATVQMNLGTTLFSLGEREAGIERLEQAVTAFRAALEVETREHAPLAWAKTQMNLGNALSTLGGRELGIQRLEEAIGAFRLSLEERPRERVPLDWAFTQMNLGVTLVTLGEREESIERLEEAIDAFRQALEERTRERMPLDWASTQMNLGIALSILGGMEHSAERLKEAINAFRQALEERTRERVPLDWAFTKVNLGVTLRALGGHDPGTKHLIEAVRMFRQALEERTQERVPLQWARTQENIGLTYRSIAKKTRDKAILLQSIEAIKSALDVYEEGRAAYDLKRARGMLADARALLAEIKAESSTP